ncbi:hypothetical protein WDZ92_31450, partial [Nostoc sp. NIES-2111]
HKRSRSTKMVHENGELRLEHFDPGDWKVAWFVTGLIFLPPCLMVIPAVLRQMPPWWFIVAFLGVIGLMVLLFASDSTGSVRVGKGEFAVKGWGSIRAAGDKMRWEDVEALEWTQKSYRVPGDDETVTPGLQAVSGKERICLAPNVSEEEARQIVEEILKVAPSLRGKVR